jgi:hypothetical protein
LEGYDQAVIGFLAANGDRKVWNANELNSVCSFRSFILYWVMLFSICLNYNVEEEVR